MTSTGLIVVALAVLAIVCLFLTWWLLALLCIAMAALLLPEAPADAVRG